jgi:putative DNA primase/helicase
VPAGVFGPATVPGQDPAELDPLDQGVWSGPHDPMPGEPRTELGYAHRLVTVYGDRLRYVPAWRRWLVWDGRRWGPDATGQADRWMKSIARRLMADALLVEDDAKRKAAVSIARAGESARGIRGALTLAGTVRGIATDPADLDADPCLLNCPNGVLDLQTGQLGEHDPALLLTKLTGGAFDPTAIGPEFEKFLGRIQPDPDMRAFLARLLGHALPGAVVEHLLPILHGGGANGKSTLVDAVLAALGDYAGTAEPGLFTERGFDAHPTGVADLFGRRLVVVHESDRGRHLAEATVKRLTGGDRIKARRMREDFWEFEPSHTAFMLTNHQPLVRGDDEGIWRRLRLVPFEVTIPPDQRDTGLGDRLAGELDAVLAWLVNGYQDWHRTGLGEPRQVQEATAAYRKDADDLGRFLDQRCLLGDHYHAGSAELYAAYTDWCRDEGVEQDSQRAFATALQNRGLDNHKDRTGRMRWKGIGLQSVGTDADSEE